MPSKPSTTPATKANASTKAPIKTLRLGRIKAAVWENEADQKKYYNVTFARTYRDEGGEFHDTESYGRDDLPLLQKLADQAHLFIYSLRSGDRSEPRE